MEDNNIEFSIKIPNKSSNKEEDDTKWKIKFENILTQLSKTEIQMYDYKTELNDLINEIEILKENHNKEIIFFERLIEEKAKDYDNLNECYEKLKKNLNLEETDRINLIEKKDTQLNLLSIKIDKLIANNQKLLKENELLKKEVKELESELEETNDKFREDQNSDYKEMQNKLDATLKNSRLLQFKLIKLEKAYNQIKIENNHLSNKLKKATDLSSLRNRPSTPNEISKSELDKAKDVLLRMHSSLQTVKGEKIRLEEQLSIAKNELITLTAKFRNQIKTRPLSPQNNTDREIEDTIRDLEERESDLQEQLKFSEQESESLRKKLSSVEQENEVLNKQLNEIFSLKSKSTNENSMESLILKVEYDEQIKNLKKELEDKKNKIIELEKRLNDFNLKIKSNLDTDSNNFEIVNKQLINHKIFIEDSNKILPNSTHDLSNDQQLKNFLNLKNTPIKNTKAKKLLSNENATSGSLFFEEKVENLERQLQKIKKDLVEKQTENEALLNLIDMKRNSKNSKRFVRSSSLQD